MNTRRVLVIRLGALGDFVLSFPAFAAIRAHEVSATITLLTTGPFAAMARTAPWFDAVAIDEKPAGWDVPALWRLARRMRGYDRVYDLQTSSRSSRYRLLAGRAEWSGIARGASHPHANADRDLLHTRERQRDQLEYAGVRDFPEPELGWLTSGGLPEALGRPYALLVPGAAPHRLKKRWPVSGYAAVAQRLRAAGILPVVVGGATDAPLAAAIPAAVDLSGRTSLRELAALASGATLAVGNDTGPMHLAAAVGCRCVVLFSADSDPALTAPRGPGGAWPLVIRVPDLSDLGVERVASAALSCLDEADAAGSLQRTQNPRRPDAALSGAFSSDKPDSFSALPHSTAR